MKAHKLDSVKDSYLEEIQFTQDGTTEMSFETPTLVPQMKRRDTATESTKLFATP